jgi:hypothetical protein
MLKTLKDTPNHKNYSMQEVVDLTDRVTSQKPKLYITTCKTIIRNDGRVKENNIMLQNNQAYKREEIHLFDRFYEQKSTGK